mgnify:CR=1 FL=1
MVNGLEQATPQSVTTCATAQLISFVTIASGNVTCIVAECGTAH